MNDLPRQKLCDVIHQYGTSMLDDQRRLKALLNDLCGEYRLEINILMGALQERVAEDLLAVQNTDMGQIVAAQLARRLEDNLGLTAEAAQWAIEAWASCLGYRLPHQEAALPSTAAADFNTLLETWVAEAKKLARAFFEQIRLSWALLRDARVPIRTKLIPLIAIAYIISPLSLIVDAIPVAGLLANIAVFLLMVALFNHVAPREVVEEHTARIRAKED
jgi:uncharacterized membrane protein YkvA (DUF1232 family)